MKIFLTLILLQFALITISAQEVVYYFGPDNGEVSFENEARYKKNLVQRNRNVSVLKSYLKENGSWKLVKQDKIRKNNKGSIEIKSTGLRLFAETIVRTYTYGPDGKIFFQDHVNGRLIQSGTTTREIPLILQDTVKLYYPNGNLRSLALYEQNRLLANQNWLKNGAQYFDNIHYYVHNTPEYSNGQAFFKQYMLAGINETKIDVTQINDLVIIGLVITEDGQLQGVHLVKGRLKELNSAIINLIKDIPGHWVPAKLNGKAVNYYMELPFNFQHREEGFDSVELSSGFLVWD